MEILLPSMNLLMHVVEVNEITKLENNDTGIDVFRTILQKHELLRTLSYPF